MVSQKSLNNLVPRTAANQPSSEARRGKKGQYLLPLLKKFLKKKIDFEDPDTKKIIHGRVKDAIIWRLILNAAQGDNIAIREILDRIDGKPVQEIKGEGFQQYQTFFTNIFQKAGLDGFPKRETEKTNTGRAEGAEESR